MMVMVLEIVMVMVIMIMMVMVMVMVIIMVWYGDGEDNHLQIIRHALIAQKYDDVSGPGHPTPSQYQISYIF